MKLEVAVVPVCDADGAKRFYETLGFRLDIDYIAGENFRVVQLTPPGSECSIIIGEGITAALPASEGPHLVVVDIEASRAELVGRGAEIGDVFQGVGGVLHHSGAARRASGLAPGHRDDGLFASFTDPDGDGCLLQEGKERTPGW